MRRAAAQPRCPGTVAARPPLWGGWPLRSTGCADGSNRWCRHRAPGRSRAAHDAAVEALAAAGLLDQARRLFRNRHTGVVTSLCADQSTESLTLHERLNYKKHRPTAPSSRLLEQRAKHRGAGEGQCMVAYEYRCNQHGLFDVSRPMGDAPTTASCIQCGEHAVRVYSVPMTGRTPAHISAVIDRAERSRDEPEVVTQLPPRRMRLRTPMAPVNPAIRKLPRP